MKLTAWFHRNRYLYLAFQVINYVVSYLFIFVDTLCVAQRVSNKVSFIITNVI